MSVSIPRETEEKLETVITSDVDPTGGDVEFAFTQDEDRPTTWFAGQWDGVWAENADTGAMEATAVSPTIGGPDTGAVVALAVGKWTGWVKVTYLPERPVRKCGTVTIQ